MSLINDYLKKTQHEAPHPDQPGDIPPILKSGGKGGSGRITLRVSMIAVLGIVAGVAYYHFQSSGQKMNAPGDLVASLGESTLPSPGKSKALAPAATTGTPEEALSAAGAAAVSPKEALHPTPPESRAPADEPVQTEQRSEAAGHQPPPVVETNSEVGKTITPEPQKTRPVAQVSPAVTIAPLKKPETSSTVDVDLNHSFQIGIIAQKDGDFREAERFYQEVLRQDPAHTGALVNLAAIYIHQNKTADAEKTLQRILRIDPKNTKALVNLGIINLTLNEREQAKRRFQEALRIDSQEETALINLAFLANQENELALAEGYYKDILRIAPQNAQVLLAYASLLEKNSRFAEALSCYQKSLEVPAVIENPQLSRQVEDRINVLRYYYTAQR